MKIHKSAIIHEGVELGQNITIGEYTVLYSGVKVKDDVKIGSHCALGTDPEMINSQNKSSLVINEGSIITNHVSINLGIETQTTIGKNCFIMNNSYIAHDCKLGDRVVVTSGVRVLGNVNLGEEVYLGSNSTIHQNSNIGSLSLIGANSFAKGNFIGGIIYAGVPAVPKKLNKIGFNRSKINENELKQLEVLANKFLID